MALLSSFPSLNILGNASSSSPTYVSPTSSASVTGNAITLTTDFKSAGFLLKVNQIPANSSQSMSVYMQASMDGGQTYDDFVSFLVNGKTTANAIAQWVRDVAPSSSGVHTPQTSALANNTVTQGPIGATWRAVATCNTSASSSLAWQVNLSAQVAQ